MNTEYSAWTQEYKKEQYSILQALGERENLWLVKDCLSEKILVMRKLPLLMQEVMKELALIDHPGIVHILDVFSFEQELYVIEEYLQGDNLAFLLEKNGGFGQKTIRIGIQLLEALVVLHQHHILHRDIKPENIIMDRLGHVVLIDFSIARLFSEEKEGDTSLKGTKSYAPPEQFGFHQTDARTDIYALGITLNELAAGKLPEEKNCRGALGKFIRRATELDPERRYSSAKKALAHLKWLRQRQIVLFSAVAVLVLSGLFLGGRVLFHGVTVVDGKLQNYPSFANYALPETGQTHLLSSSFSVLPYPAIRLEDGESITFMEELSVEQEDVSEAQKTSLNQQQESSDTPKTLSATRPAIITAKQSEEQFHLTCSLLSSPQQTNPTVFTFTDSFYPAYGEDTATQGYIPEYELLCGDFDDDGQEEFLMIMARCKRILSPVQEEYDYYFTQYTCLWVIDLDEKDQFVCTEPLLIFDDRPPSFQYHFVLSDEQWMLYSYQDGKWIGSNWDDSYYLENGEWYLKE